MKLLDPFKSLKEPLFARLYFAQAISLLGDAFTWIGIALLAFEFGGHQSAKILAMALTLRVSAYILFGSYAGIIADHYNRKKILIFTNIARMVIVFSLVFIHHIWQMYILIFLLNIFNAFFSPAFKACIPQLISRKENYKNAIAMANATWQLLGMIGPGLAGILAIFWGSRQIFIVDAFSFIVSSLLVSFIPFSFLNKKIEQVQYSISEIWHDVVSGTKLIFGNGAIRFALLMELVVAIAGAQILVNTVGHIKGVLMLTDKEFGWAMTAFGIGATIAAFTVNTIDKSKNKTLLLIAGALMVSLSVSLANSTPYAILLILWVIAGLGQSFTDMPSQILIAENIPLGKQGKAYGSHFAWTHLWWAIGYPIAGITGSYFKNHDFLIGGLLALGMLMIICLYRFTER
ncbi:MAG: MFS transporter [Bacteroidota bacterium]|nr:MFS transporter [Bacteroidota bacterium]